MGSEMCIRDRPAIAGAYFAAKLGVAEYLDKIRKQAGILILREIQPEYAVPVGVWQIREAIREAMKQKPILTDTLDSAVSLSTKRMSISKTEWFAHGKMLKLLRQKSIEDFF